MTLNAIYGPMGGDDVGMSLELAIVGLPSWGLGGLIKAAFRGLSIYYCNSNPRE
jgi:hypothetical protein